ncbi:hypothetical protein JI721_15620 [Alicyclobacillus cycloheptanicus]|jgi:hypothetical protein|uniref:CBS domain containing-hemolysin-like protein n=1 Tax=Alicyclobacillus cycloheptanicus TaxID=1457 RepID=A0ABT9XDJ5_9BACL|nr:hypothetical protein [Alicyclobacillus cycloheptanicus]MDQ0188369.1 CBS domain containing-hemolysin-like protein [Alicyclobacillus cycloheptanicus]WDM01077.1 hypothetical protein JI721_15620 [Alicyclobacillus cycloheptanicus]
MKRAPWHRAIRFALAVAGLSFVVGGLFDTSTIYLNTATWYVGAVIVFIIVIVGALFDMLGVAAAAARETPFHAMASKRVFAAKRAISIVRNAEKVSSICSDVIGDIAGVLSGAGALAVGAQLVIALHVRGWQREFIIILLTAFTTAVTVAAKAIGKTLAIRSPTPIVLGAARVAETVLFYKREHRKVKGKRVQ